MSPVTEDHDSPWKEALELFFQPFLQLLFPDIHAAIDWTQPCSFLDKELQKLAPDGHIGRRHADKLVQVCLLTGEQRWLLVHVEVQGQRDASFPERMFVYYHRIREHHGKEVLSLAVLTDTHPHYRPDRFEALVLGSGVSFRFRMVKLLDYRDRIEELLADSNPFALLVVAQLTAKLQKKDGRRKVDSLISYYRLAGSKQLDRALVGRLVVFLEWLVALPPGIEPYYTAQVSLLKEESAMPYVSILERMATKKGLDQGREEGLQEGRAGQLLQQLRLKFGTLPGDVEQRVRQARPSELGLWAERVLFADSLDAVLATGTDHT